MVKNKELALKTRDALIKYGIGTKILPEAITWHFAGDWNHIKELTDRYDDLSNKFESSRKILNSCVAIPINISMPDNFENKIKSALKTVFK